MQYPEMSCVTGVVIKCTYPELFHEANCEGCPYNYNP